MSKLIQLLCDNSVTGILDNYYLDITQLVHTFALS